MCFKERRVFKETFKCYIKKQKNKKTPKSGSQYAESILNYPKKTSILKAEPSDLKNEPRKRSEKNVTRFPNL